ncbi:MAG TPA: BamA/TamA family outer membrane protein [Vicinamibacterales bacterium]|jgi:outer membrane protein insertion porin family/translocation and assembly module TamA|nr:BamA/TamA family outer membrane protein [Vicinamibacterales bacterium]
MRRARLTSPSARLVAAALLFWTLGAGPAAAQAQAPAGAQAQPATPLPPRPDPKSVARPIPPRIKVTSLKIHGADQLGSGRVASVLGTHASSWLPWGRKRYFDRAVFNADIGRIEAYYVDRGYPDAKVTAFDATLNKTQDAIRISITVNEGQPQRVDRVALEGFDVVPPREMRILRRQLPLQPGAIADRAQITATQTMATRALQDRGYPLALVSTEETREADKRVSLTLRASTGAMARYGTVTVAGNMSVGDDVITRTLAVKPGNRFSLATIQLSQRRLYDLGLFQLATVKPETEQVVDGVVPVNVTVAEAKHRQIRLGAGYGSEEKVRGEAQWKHVNFLGGARTFNVESKWSSLDRGVRTSFTQPYLFSPKVSLTFSAQGWFADEPAFQLNTSGGRATVTYELTQRNPVSGRGGESTISVAFIGEREDYTITPEFLDNLTVRSQLIALGLNPRGEGRGLLGAIALDYRRSTTTNVLDARRGYILNAHTERAGGGLPGDFEYVEYTLEARHYQTLGRLGVLASRARIGTIDGGGDDTVCFDTLIPATTSPPSTMSTTVPHCPVPFFKRYFLGGSNSLRGWGRFEVSELSGTGLPIGGHSMLEMSTEVRAPLFGKIAGVLFLDAGSVEIRPWDIAFKAMRYDVGPGLRYITPIGPIRVDFGYQLNPIEGLLVDGTPEARRWRVHFSLGQAF